VTATGIITGIDGATRVLAIKTEITNQHGQAVLTGEAKVKVLRFAHGETLEQQKSTRSMSELLSGQVALVTGASRGIGRAVAKTLAAHGAKVWINYHRSEGAARNVGAEIEAAGGRFGLVRADVTKPEDVARMMSEIAAAGGLNILVNNAGPKIRSAGLEDLAWSDVQSAFEQVAGSAFLVIQQALPHLKLSRGTIINVLTAAILGRTSHNWLPYVMAKSAMLGMSKNLAQELGPRGIRVNMVSPSLVDTDLVANLPERIRQMTVSRTPLRRLATVDDVAGVVLFLASRYADFVTGDNVLVTGGDVMA
jgi:3-oxoacyl-[acyl-carrier protein] reductase